MITSKHEERRVFAKIEADSEALAKLKDLSGGTFESWLTATLSTLQEYEQTLKGGFPTDPDVALALVANWESKLFFALHQAGRGRCFQRRAMGVMREVLAKRGVRATESSSDARVWQMDEAATRWEAVSQTIQEWLWQARSAEKALMRPSGPGKPR